MSADTLSTLVDAALPAEPLAVYTLLHCWEAKGLGGPTVRRVALHFGVSYDAARKWLRDLLDLNLVISKRAPGQRRTRLYWTSDSISLKECSVRRTASGRALRCKVCGRLNPRGQWCARCKQTHGRSDRAWWPLCDRLLKQGKTPQQVSTALTREAALREATWHFSIWDFTPPGQDLKAPGIVSRGLLIGALGEDWRDRQTAYFGGESEEW